MILPETFFTIDATFVFVVFGIRDLEARDDLDFRVEALPASTFSFEKPDAALAMLPNSLPTSIARAGDADNPDSDFFVSWFRRRFLGTAVVSSWSEEALRFRNERDPSSGSSSRIRVLKTEWEPGLDTPRWAGSKSRVNFVAEDRRRETASSVLSGSTPFSTQDGHLHLIGSNSCQKSLK